MIDKMDISGFKCFRKNTFDLKKITVLCGSNGTGKSSVIQALLLVRQAIEKNSHINDHKNGWYTISGWNNLPISLNGIYELGLGTIDNVFNENYDTVSEIAINQLKFSIRPSDVVDDVTSAKLHLDPPQDLKETDQFILKNTFYYLNAERLGPRQNLTLSYSGFPHCGHKGEFTAQVIFRNQFKKVDSSRMFKNSNSENLSIQLDAWLDYVCPGTTVRVNPLGTLMAQIRLRNSALKNDTIATNIGFGISYCLPILVNGLIAEKDSMLVVENPEAHLHPKGQSNIGYFLGKVASSGVKVLIETHSEHVINGIRRSVLESDELANTDVGIYFFNDPKEGQSDPLAINIESNGDLSDFPVDFFDQTRQDLLQILKLARR